MAKKCSLTIGALAREAGVSVETIRYYQRRGLLEQPAKPTMGGFRCYTSGDVGRILLIKRAQQLGFTLAEIAELAPHVDKANCRAARVLTEKKLKAVESQLLALEGIRIALKSLIMDCGRECSQNCFIGRKLLTGFGDKEGPSSG